MPEQSIQAEANDQVEPESTGRKGDCIKIIHFNDVYEIEPKVFMNLTPSIPLCGDLSVFLSRDSRDMSLSLSCIIVSLCYGCFLPHAFLRYSSNERAKTLAVEGPGRRRCEIHFSHQGENFLRSLAPLSAVLLFFAPLHPSSPLFPFPSPSLPSLLPPPSHFFSGRARAHHVDLHLLPWLYIDLFTFSVLVSPSAPSAQLLSSCCSASHTYVD
eukprot:574233-Hanusia_phi.AAC.1